jgi:hypothetical protein
MPLNIPTILDGTGLSIRTAINSALLTIVNYINNNLPTSSVGIYKKTFNASSLDINGDIEVNHNLNNLATIISVSSNSGIGMIPNYITIDVNNTKINIITPGWDTGHVITGEGSLYGITKLNNGNVVALGAATGKMYTYNVSTSTWDTGVSVGGTPIAICQSPITGRIFVTITIESLVYSDNLGTSWSGAVSLGTNVQGIVALANGTIVTVAEVPGGIALVSNDTTGLTYTPHVMAAPADGICVLPNQNLLAVYANSGTVVQQSTDGGLTWTVIGTPPGGSVAMCALDNTNILLAGLNGYVYTSVDGGSTWGTGVALGSSLYGIAKVNNDLVMATDHSTGKVYSYTSTISGTWNLTAVG